MTRMRTLVLVATAVGLCAGIQIARSSGQVQAGAPITYFIADGKGADGYRSGDRQLALWALDTWQRAAPGRIRFEPATEDDALVRLYWTESGDGRYGEMRPLMVGVRRGAALYIQPDVRLLGDDIEARAARDELFRDSVVYLTCVHELGHALGLVHTSEFRDIMYFFGFGGDFVQYFNRYRIQLRDRNDIATAPVLSENDLRRIAALFPK
jgi:hypothetical protein